MAQEGAVEAWRQAVARLCGAGSYRLSAWQAEWLESIFAPALVPATQVHTQPPAQPTGYTFVETLAVAAVLLAVPEAHVVCVMDGDYASRMWLDMVQQHLGLVHGDWTLAALELNGPDGNSLSIRMGNADAQRRTVRCLTRHTAVTLRSLRGPTLVLAHQTPDAAALFPDARSILFVTRGV